MAKHLEILRLKNWARNCHNDSKIDLKIKKKYRWFVVSNYISEIGNFDVDNYNHQELWKLILFTINNLDHFQIRRIKKFLHNN